MKGRNLPAPQHRKVIVFDSYSSSYRVIPLLNTENTMKVFFLLLLFEAKRISPGKFGPFCHLKLLSVKAAASAGK